MIGTIFCILSQKFPNVLLYFTFWKHTLLACTHANNSSLLYLYLQDHKVTVPLIVYYSLPLLVGLVIFWHEEQLVRIRIISA